MHNYIIFDFETGGLKYSKNPALEVALICLNSNDYSESHRYESFIKPYGDLVIEEQALKVNGLKHKDFMNAPELKDVVHDLCGFFSESNKGGNFRTKPILVGQNVKFDIGYLVDIFNRCKVDISKYVACDDSHGKPYPHYIDTIDLARMKWRGDQTMTNYKLSDICEKAGIDLLDAHRAMNDVIATKEVFVNFGLSLRNTYSSNNSDESEKEVRFRDNFELKFKF